MTHSSQSDGGLIVGGVELLQAAHRTAQAAGLPPELLAAAFEGALALALQGTSPSVSPRGVAAPTVGVAPTTQAAAGGRMAGLAAKLGVEHDRLSQVFYEEDDQLLLGLPASRFGSRKADAARRIGLLVTVARQFDGEEQWTPVSVLREACQEYNAFDVSNFAKHILSLDDVLQFQGNGAQRKVRLTRPGLEKAAEFVAELTS